MNRELWRSAIDQDRRRLVVGGLAAAGLIGLGRPASGAPVVGSRHPVTLLAPGNPGGGWDQFCRVIQYAMRQEKIVSAPVEVVNRGGAGGTIALAEFVSRDRGNPNVLMGAGSILLTSSIAHDSPVKVQQTTPLAKLASDYLVVGVRQDSPFRHIDQLLEAWARAPQSVTWCGGSAGGGDHILVGMMAEAAGVPPGMVRYVAYSGGGEASAALLGGQVTAGVNGWSEWRSLRDDGRVRFLAGSSVGKRIDGVTPTFEEQGLEIGFENWRAVFLPPGLSQNVIDQWLDVIQRVRASSTWRSSLAKYNWDDSFLAGAELLRFITEEERRFEVQLARLGISSGGSGYAALGPWAFPAAIAVGGGVAAVGVALERRNEGPTRSDTAASVEAPEAAPNKGAADEDRPSWRRFGAALGLVLIYFGAMQSVGFLISTPVFILALCRLSGTRSLVRDGLVGLVLTGLIWGLFTHVLQISIR